MKINKILLENVELVDDSVTEDDFVKLESLEEAIDLDDPNDRNAISKLAVDILKGWMEEVKENPEIAQSVGTAINPEENTVSNKVVAAAKKVADDAYAADELIEADLVTASTDAVYALNNSLDVAINQKKAGVDSTGSYPNIILSGLAGFGKTAQVKSFCKEHHLNLFACDAKSLDVATVGGIPYPKKDANGELKQVPIASSYWDKLSLPNTVLFLDEFNRAADNVAGTLLELINSHDLPITTEGEDGQYSNIKHFDNILFTVIAINPASNIFANVNEFTPEKVSRGIALIDVKGDRNELLTHLTKVYNAILENPLLPEDVHNRYEGQLNLATALLSAPAFTFDDAVDVEEIHTGNNSEGSLTQFLNYRTITGALFGCNGTKLHFLKNLNRLYHFSKKKTLMIENILKSYADKPTKGNSIFTKAQQQMADTATAAQKTQAASDTQSILSDFMQGLDDAL